jgi:hypothetical protein
MRCGLTADLSEPFEHVLIYLVPTLHPSLTLVIEVDHQPRELKNKPEIWLLSVSVYFRSPLLLKEGEGR